MAKKETAGILMYRFRDSVVEVLLAHPGGPFWHKKDVGAWSIPKGEIDEHEDALEAAKREFQEEIGFIPRGNFLTLGPPVRQRGGKLVQVWAVEGDCDTKNVKSNTFSMEWPPHSGKQQHFPEVDRAEWFTLGVAKNKIHRGQVVFLEGLCRMVQQ